MSKNKPYSAARKVEILREHFENQVAISELCERYGITPQTFYLWKKQLFEGALEFFSQPKSARKKSARKLEKLEKKLKDRDSLITELVSENIALKKSLNGDV